MKKYIKNFLSGTVGSGEDKINVLRKGFKGCKFSIGEDSIIDGKIVFERDNAEVRIGSRVFLSGSTKVIASESIEIGDDVLIAWGTTIVDHDSHSVSFSKRKDDVVKWKKGEKDWSHVNIAPVNISDKAWIGFNVIILKGITIGEGAVVAAGSVVTKDVPAWTVVAGNPARMIREIPPEDR